MTESTARTSSASLPITTNNCILKRQINYQKIKGEYDKYDDDTMEIMKSTLER